MTEQKQAMSNHRKIGYALTEDQNAPAYNVVFAKYMCAQQRLADSSIDLAKAGYIRKEYARAALLEEDGGTYFPRGRAYVVASQTHETQYATDIHNLLHNTLEWNALAPEHRTREMSALAYRCGVCGLGTMRQKVWSASKKHPYKLYKRAADALASGQFDDFKRQTLSDDPCMYDAVAEAHVTDYVDALGTELSVTDCAYQGHTQLVDNILKENNHATNRRILTTRNPVFANGAPTPTHTMRPFPHTCVFGCVTRT